MRVIELFQETVKRRKSVIDAALALRKESTLDTSTVSPTELTRLAVKPSTRIQNADGTFIYMAEYDY